MGMMTTLAVDPLTATLFVVGIGLSLAASLLLKPRTPKQEFTRDNTPTTLSTRGVHVPLLIGRRRVGAIFAWAGNRDTRVEGGGGGKGASPEVPGETVYFEDGWHVLATGPCDTLRRIWQDGKVIWEGPIDRVGTPSGSVVAVAGDGSFEIYWGEFDQPYSARLSAGISLQSQWPYHCYVLWRGKRLGSSARWPILDYDLESTTGGAHTLLDDSTSTGINPADAIEQVITAPFPHGAGVSGDLIDDDTLDEMATLCDTEHLPMHVLSRDGIGADQLVADILQDAGVMLVHRGLRLAFVPIRPPSGDVPLLDADTIEPNEPEFTHDLKRRPPTSVVYTFPDEEANFKDQDVTLGADAASAGLIPAGLQTADFDDYMLATSESVQINTATHVEVAGRIAARRSQEDFTARSTVKINVMRGGALLRPGDMFDVENILTAGNASTPTAVPSVTARLRVVGVTIPTDAPGAVVDAVIDGYSVTAYSVSPPGKPGEGEPGYVPPLLDAEPDLAFTWLQLPSDFTGGDIAIAVARIRAHHQIIGANVWASLNGASYANIGNQAYSAGGQLVDELLDTTDTIVKQTETQKVVIWPSLETFDIEFETDPVYIKAANQDILDVPSLVGDDVAWARGDLIAVIGDEVMFVRRVVPKSEAYWDSETAYDVGDYVEPWSSTGLRYRCTTAGTSGESPPYWPIFAGSVVNDGTAVWTAEPKLYRLDGLIRARWGTTKQTHAADSWVFLIDATNVNIISPPTWAVGDELCVKTQPYTTTGAVDLGDVTAVCGEFVTPVAIEYGEGINTETDDLTLTTEHGIELITGD